MIIAREIGYSHALHGVAVFDLDHGIIAATDPKEAR